MLAILLTVIHVVVCLMLIGVVLLQSGKAADLAGAFGGMGSQTAFGPRGAQTTLSRATTIAAILFMLTSLSLSIVATRRGRTGNSVLDKTSSKPTTPTTPPATPATPAPSLPK
jgi:preprotein translocase subunit SecG